MAAVCVAGTCDANVFKPHSQGATLGPWRRVDQATGSLGAVCSRSQRVQVSIFSSPNTNTRGKIHALSFGSPGQNAKGDKFPEVGEMTGIALASRNRTTLELSGATPSINVGNPT